MASDVRCYIAWTDLGEAAQNFDDRMLALGVDLPRDEGDGRKYVMHTYEGRAASDLEARLGELPGYVAPSDTGVADHRGYAYTLLGEAAADLERRLSLALAQLSA